MGTLNLDLRLSGSLMEPRVNGNINANNLTTSLQPNIPDLGLDLEIKTINQELTFNGSGKNGISNFMTIPETYLYNQKHGWDFQNQSLKKNS